MDSESGGSGSEKKQRKYKRRSKYGGLFTYKTRLRKEQIMECPFIRPEPEKENVFACTVCQKEVNCGHQSKGDVIHDILSMTYV